MITRFDTRAAEYVEGPIPEDIDAQAAKLSSRELIDGDVVRCLLRRQEFLAYRAAWLSVATDRRARWADAEQPDPYGTPPMF